MRTTWPAALAWRLERHYLGDSRALSVIDVVDRLVAVPAWLGDQTLAVGMRLDPSAPVEDALTSALAEGRLVKVFAFRGATHLMTPRAAADHLALRAAGRMWERSSWVEHYRLTPEEWPGVRAAVRAALADGPLPPTEMADAIAGDPRWTHLREPLSTLGTFLKPFFWQGDICFGPEVDGAPTLARLEDNPHWPGIPDLDEAGHRAITAYLSAYGPATPAHLHYWLGEGLGAGKRRIDRWLRDLADQLVPVQVDGEETLILGQEVQEAGGVGRPGRREPSVGAGSGSSVRLMPGHDQWVLGPGTADQRIVPPEHRQHVTRGANLLVIGGVVSGTWTARGGALTLTPWQSAGARADSDLASGPLSDDIAQQVARVGALRREKLELMIETVAGP